MTRRFFAALVGLPFLGRIVSASRKALATEQPREPNPGWHRATSLEELSWVCCFGLLGEIESFLLGGVKLRRKLYDEIEAAAASGTLANTCASNVEFVAVSGRAACHEHAWIVRATAYLTDDENERMEVAVKNGECGPPGPSFGVGFA